ncbi:MAG: NTP transferase domain-containing protein [Candidatus Tectomicrobia bacterium]|nr:NTP transferase domain-containing protein [Candidatus Tectomicrobia bacterium]
MTLERDIAVVILCAGKGTRMKSALVKVLHALAGRPILSYLLDLAQSLKACQTLVVIGYQGEKIREAFSGRGITFVEQREQLGTGHAVLQTEPILKDFRGDVLILYGDVPLLRKETLERLIEEHRKTRAVLTALTARVENPTGYGRVIRGEGKKVEKVVEEKDASPEERLIDEINAGIYCVNASFLFNALHKIQSKNLQGEYYLTDIVAIASQEGLPLAAIIVEDFQEVMGINDQVQLAHAEQVLRLRMSGGEET